MFSPVVQPISYRVFLCFGLKNSCPGCSMSFILCVCVSSYLHCEWATEQQLEKDKRIQQKIKRFKMKQAQRALLFADVRPFGCPCTLFIGIFWAQISILYEPVSIIMMRCLWGSASNTSILFANPWFTLFCVLLVWAGGSVCIYLNFSFTCWVFNVVRLISVSRWWVGTWVYSLKVFWIYSSCHSCHLSDGRRAL